MKKTLAIILIILFVLMIIGETSQAGKNHAQAGDFSGAVVDIVFMLLLFAGLFFSARWLMKLSGHTYKVGRQATAALLFWYSAFATFIGLMMPVFERNTFGLISGGVMVTIWLTAAYACKRWQRRLRVAERAQESPACT
jgi:hypothetical protein